MTEEIHPDAVKSIRIVLLDPFGTPVQEMTMHSHRAMWTQNIQSQTIALDPPVNKALAWQLVIKVD